MGDYVGVNLAGWLLHIPRDLFYTITELVHRMSISNLWWDCGKFFNEIICLHLLIIFFKDFMNSFKQKMKFNKI